MQSLNKPAVSILVGVLISIVVCVQLVLRIMEGGDSISFEQFLEVPANVLFIVYIGILFFCAWIVKGINNRSLLVLWVLLDALNYFINFHAESKFLYENKNIYLFSWAATIAIVPLLIGLEIRRLVIFRILVLLKYWGLFLRSVNTSLSSLKSTKFDLALRNFVIVWFSWEFIFSAYLTIYAFTYEIPKDGSIGQTMRQNEHFVPFDIYHLGTEVITIGLIFLIITYTARDLRKPDDGDFHFSQEEKKKLIADYKKKIKR